MPKSKKKISYIDERLCFALYSTSKSVIGKYQPYLAKLNMSYPQYLVYITLMEHGKLSVGGLGKLLFLDSGTLTPLLKRMEANGLLIRERSDDDERLVLVHLTKKAHEINDEIAEMQDAVSCSIELEQSEFCKLRDQLKSINLNLRKS